MKINRNPSGKTPEELAKIHCAELIEKGLTHDVMFDCSIVITCILPFPHCMPDYEYPCSLLQERIEMGDLDELFEREIKEAKDLKDEQGYLVQAESITRDFTSTIFEEDGHMKNGCNCGPASWVMMAFSPTIAEAYAEITKRVVEKVAAEIVEGLKSDEPQP